MSLHDRVPAGEQTELVAGPPGGMAPAGLPPQGPPAMAHQTTSPPAWHPDPANPQGAVRWWDGTQWTGYVQPLQAPPVPQAPAPGQPWPVQQGHPGAPPQTPDGQPVFRLTISRVTSVIILTTKRSTTFTGTYEQLRKSYRNVLVYNLLLGWWGFPFGLVWTPMTLARNASALRQLKQLAGRP